MIDLRLKWLNHPSSVSNYEYETILRLPKEFPGEELATLEIGSPYGGAVEMMAKVLKGKGKAYAYDTFEGHPRDLSDNPNSDEATCMDFWYRPDQLGTEKLDYDYQRKVLDEEGCSNAVLVRGRISEDSFKDIERVHFAMLDLDLIKPTRTAYNAIKDKIVKGGYLFLHDASSPTHLPLIYQFVFEEVIPSGIWEVVLSDEASTLVILKKK